MIVNGIDVDPIQVLAMLVDDIDKRLRDIEITPQLGWAGGGGEEGGFSGTVYIAGNKVDLTGTPKEWVRVNVSDGTAVYHDGPPSNPFPPNEEWYYVAKTFGDIHITRFG